jgi:hypothetical protein
MQKRSKQPSSTSAPEGAKPTAVPNTLTSAAGGAKPPARKRRQARVDVRAAVTPKEASAPAPKPKKPAVSTAPVKPQRRFTIPGLTPKPSPKGPRVSALDAAAQILAAVTGTEAKEGITTADLIERMAKQKLWTSPGGKTPQATLYAAMVREITAKGPTARFRKVSRGHFAAASSGGSASKPSTRPVAPLKRAKP